MPKKTKTAAGKSPADPDSPSTRPVEPEVNYGTPYTVKAEEIPTTRVKPHRRFAPTGSRLLGRRLPPRHRVKKPRPIRVTPCQR